MRVERLIAMELKLLLNVMLQGGLYFGSLSWLAWHFERRNSIDGFHLVIAYVAGALCLDVLWTVSIDPAWLLLLTASSVAWMVDFIWPRFLLGKNGQDTLVLMIAGSSVALLMFDWATAYSPLAIARGIHNLSLTAGIVAGVCWFIIAADSLSRRGRVVRLGQINRWAVLYWARPEPDANTIYFVARFALWFSVLSFPIVTTGLLSSTMLKDVVLGILMARVVGSRGPIVLFGMAMTLAAMRTGAAYVIVSPLTLPVVEATAFLALLAWLRYRTTRTPWNDAVGR